MNLIEEFIKVVKNNEKSFSLTIKNNRVTNEKHFSFMQCEVGKARYIYGDYDFYDNNFHSKLDLKPELVAIVVNDIIYITDAFFFDVYRNEDIFSDKLQLLSSDKENEYIKEVMFPEFYNSLQINEIESKDSIKSLELKAREILLSKNPQVQMPTKDSIFDLQDIANALCGFIDLKEEGKRRLDEQKDKWVSIKSTNEKIKALMLIPDIVKDWELKIAEGLRSVDAKTVFVEFELNDRRASAKINPSVILNKISDNDCFLDYDFQISKHGSELIKKLGAGNWHSDENSLRCKDITKITFGKKTLYERD